MEIDADRIQELGQEYVDTGIELVPRLVFGVLAIIIGLWLARRVKRFVEKALVKGGVQASAADAVARIVRWFVLATGILVGIATFVPSFEVRDVVQLLGLGGVAIGFAFRDILQNFLAGLIILMTEPFRVGDLIIIGDYEGEVEEIQTRSTTIRTYDGTQVVIPNATVFAESITVLTAYDARRWHYDFEVGYEDDLDAARELVMKTLEQSDLVLEDPPPRLYTLSLNESGVGIRAYWWVRVPDTNPLEVWDEVVRVVRARFAEAGVEIPYPTRSVLVAGGGDGDGRESDAALGG